MRVHDFAFRSINGASMPLERWKCRPLLLVNTASECGYTQQYGKLQSLWEEYRPSSLVVIGIPCNDFGGQEPGDDATIQEFCSSNFGVTFPMSTKQNIISAAPTPYLSPWGRNSPATSCRVGIFSNTCSGATAPC